MHNRKQQKEPTAGQKGVKEKREGERKEMSEPERGEKW